ncbi:phage shock protein B [Azospirillaceae bacterium]
MPSGLIIAVIVFLLVVIPVWVVVHYVLKWRGARRLIKDDEHAIAEVWNTAARLEKRILVLEQLLDSNNPNWRHSSR